MKNNINLHKAPETRVYAKNQGEASTWDGPLDMEQMPIAPGRSSGADGIKLLAKNEYPYQGGPITERAKGL
jgi:hypothetical protein